MNKTNLNELAELNLVELYYECGNSGGYKREIKIKKYLDECGLKSFYVELNNYENMDDFTEEIIVCNFDSDLKDKFVESGIMYGRCYKNYLDIGLYEDIKNNVIQTKYAKNIGDLYLIQDNVTYDVEVIVKKKKDKVDVMLNFSYITKVDDDKVPLLTPERFELVRGFNTKHYFVYDGIEDVYYWTSDMLNEELEERDTEEEREKLILEDTSWFVEKDVFLDDCDL